MLDHLKKLFFFLSKMQKKRFYFLIILMTISGALEIFSVISIVEYINFLTFNSEKKSFVILDNFIDKKFLLDYLNVQSFGIFIIIILIINTILALTLIYYSSKFSYLTGGEIEYSLYKLYLDKNYLYHVNESSSNLLNKLNKLVPRITNNILEPTIIISSKLFFIIPMIIGLGIYQPLITILAVSISILLYLVFFTSFKKLLWKLGKFENNITKQKYSILQESFGAIKDIKIGSHYTFFHLIFKKIYISISSIGVKKSLIGKSPKYLIELLVFITIIFFIIILFTFFNYNFTQIATSVSIFIVSAFKILPAFQAIYYNSSLIRNGLPALLEMQNDFTEIGNTIKTKSVSSNLKKSLNKFERFYLNDVSFTYGIKQKTLKNISTSIKNSEKVAITGPSGSGKSTMIHIIAGLIDPQQGNIKVDEKFIDQSNKHEWQNLIGFVPQNIFLSERTILENIAYGINKDEINVQRVKDICTIVKLDELIESSPNGLDTLIGERGAKISGGQQQRMGIARAIYKNPKILIFDEATNALDVKTESEILNSIKNLNKNITIIMITHRLEIIKKFDKIIFLENGLLVDEANYDNLYNKNINFKKLVNLHNMDKKKN